jgi:hypothetical protein
MRQKEQDIEKAKKDKREADKRRLESEKKALERQKNWAEKLEAVDQAELDAAHQGSLTAFARQQSLNLEEQLFKARAGSGSDKLSKQSSDLLIQQLELQTLEAQQKYRKLAHELARQEEALAGQRLDLYKAARQ